MPRLQDERRHSGVVIHDGSSDGALGKLDSSALIFSSSSSLFVDVLGTGRRWNMRSLQGSGR
jgi:hypothetical protein